MRRNIYVMLTALAVLTTTGIAIEDYGVEGEDYAAGEVLVKFTEPISTIFLNKTGICVTGIPEIDALNEEYGVYEMEQLCPEPSEWDFDDGDGKWFFDEFYSSWDESGIGNLYKLSFGAFVDSVNVAEEYTDSSVTEYASPNVFSNPCFVPSDEHYLRQGYLHHSEPYGIKAEKAWDHKRGNPIIKVAVIDTGIKYNHEDIQNRLLRGYNYVDHNWDPYDRYGHGTPVTGIIAANTNNAVGVAGIDWYCRIIPMKVSDIKDFPRDNIISAVYDSCRLGAYIINMSFSSPISTTDYEEVMGFAYGQGRLLIASSGNEGTTEDRYPAAYPEVVSVGATDIDTGLRYHWSSYGDNLELVAPSVNFTMNIENHVYFGYYNYFGGTSASAPVISGVAALTWGKHLNWTNGDVRLKLRNSVRTPGHGQTGWHPETGYGIIDAIKALDYHPPEDKPVGVSGNGNDIVTELSDTKPDIQENAREVIISPNPIKSNANIAFASTGGRYDVAIYDIAGRKVKEWYGNSTGYVSLNWNTSESNAGAGVYFIKIETGGRTDVHKIIISR